MRRVLVRLASLALALECALPGRAAEPVADSSGFSAGTHLVVSKRGARRADDSAPQAETPQLGARKNPAAASHFRVGGELRAVALPETNPEGLPVAAPRNPFDGRDLHFREIGAFALVSANVENNRERYQPLVDPRARIVPGNDTVYKRDPVYDDTYNAEEQLYIYGGKHLDATARPLLELGRELYQYGPLKPGINLFGKKNLVFPQVLIFGDFRQAVAYNDNGAKEKGLFAAKLNLDVDIRITATERIHAFFTPLDRDGQFTRLEFAGNNRSSDFVLNPIPQALFFEGDLARIASGFTGTDNKYDIPFTFGLIPLITQNGIWLQDAFNGFAFTIPARNSPHLGISNMDITFFAGFDQVTTRAIDNDHSADVFGIAGFVELQQGYLEFGYGYTLGRKDFNDLSYHNLTAAFTRRYFDTISNSVRLIVNVGQDPEDGHRRTADGAIILIENSLITPKPLTLVPYLNLFAGFNKPQSLARAAGAGGILVNTGLSFETDGLTGFPKIDDSGHNTFGGALGLEYLFSFDQQIVFELAGLSTFGDEKDRIAKGTQLALGIRYQRPLNNDWIFRADIIAASREDEDDLLGFRMELRRKF